MANNLPDEMNAGSQDDIPEAVNTPVKLNKEKLRGLGQRLASKFLQYEMDRRLAELMWTRNARQVLGVYDPEIDSKMDVNRSRAYPKITRVKCVSMLSRLMNLLFQADDKNWTIEPSAVPNLDAEDLQSVLDKLNPQQTQPSSMPGMPPMGPPPVPDDEVIEQAIRDFAAKRAKRLELEIEDQLDELGGTRSEDYVALCRKVLMSGIQYGMGILKGPFVQAQQQRRWTQGTDGRLQAETVEAMRPRFEFVPIWDYYPDMSAKTLAQMEGQFQRIVMSKHQVIMLKQRTDFFPDQIDDFLQKHQTGNYMRRAFETDLKAIGVQINVTYSERNKFEAIVWDGNISGRELQSVGIDVPEDKLDQDLMAQVWLMGNNVIKAELNPWSELETDGEIPVYHHFVFEDDESTLVGNGLPRIVRDSQMGVCAGARMMLDMASVQRMAEVNVALLDQNQDTTSMQPDKIFYRYDDNPSTINVPAVRPITMPTYQEEYQNIIKIFSDFADQETFVNPATGGDLSKGPSEPFRTAAGASMLQGNAALPFKDVVRNFDSFTESVIGSLIVFNKNFNTNPEVKGDFQPVARGATSLIAKEVLGIQLDNLAATLTDEEKKYINFRELAAERMRVRDLPVDKILVDELTAQQIDQASQQAAQQQAETQQEFIKAQIRETLAKAMKEITAADKNTAQAQAETDNTALNAMEKGLQAGAQQDAREQAAATAKNAGTNSGSAS